MESDNRALVERFIQGRGLAPGTETNYFSTLRRLDRFLNGKPFKSITEDDMRRFYSHLKTTMRSSSLSTQIINLKTFFRHLHGCRKYVYPDCVSWMHKPNERFKLPVDSHNDLLKEDEVLKIVEGSSTARDRALWLTLWEGGLRIGEALSMKVGSLVFDEYGCYTLVSGKTGARRVRLVNATPYIRQYLNFHPGRNDPDSPLWLSKGRSTSIATTTAQRNLKKAALRAGVHKKRLTTHLFRHSRLTSNARFMTEAELCVFAGWTQGSTQTRTYVHLSGSDLDDKILHFYGLKDESSQTPKEEKLKSKPCPRCGELNPPTGKYCYKCGAYLTLEDAVKAEQAQREELEELRRRLDDEEKKMRRLTDLFNSLAQALSLKESILEHKILHMEPAKIKRGEEN